jgi:hypothetical protein
MDDAFQVAIPIIDCLSNLYLPSDSLSDIRDLIGVKLDSVDLDALVIENF